ncbi:nuclear transport factor 2 family protein [Streptomyces sp. JV185]|uniref:nuclear transport factor 2 family protein n=1 Tax=Streptomyces sp. JV185 TaxID=858638 RepID=UPI002E789DE5|nr:nuclear transport factor 2 family protein [Streptomyces sp. JV185]MEE1769458.1 nuclear transport factor 2 family protein [Streptomyces sp. JV185]
MRQNISETATSFLRCLEAHDLAGCRSMCTGGATVWQNDGQGVRAIDATLQQFEAFAADVDALRYDIIRQFQNANEVFQQQVLHLRMADGSDSKVHAAVCFRFEGGGLIDRIEECIYPVPTAEAP